MLNKNKLLLLCILFIGIFFRLYGNNWDQGWHLHPDERFLTMVGIDIKLPTSLPQYLDQTTSPFNPVNKGHEFYVYGTFPVLLNKIIAQYMGNDTYDLFNLQGRVISGIADFLIVLIIFKILELIEKKLKLASSIKYLGAFFYAIAVLPIQLSHYFTVDTFLNLFCWLSFYYSIRFNVLTFKRSNVITDICLSGLFLGLAVASKISAIYMAPLIGVFIAVGLLRLYYQKSTHRNKTISVILSGVSFFVFFYLALRLGSPYYFETNNILDPSLSNIFMNNIGTLKSFEKPLGYFPPAIQWFSKSYDFPIKNIIFFGVGPLYFLISCFGAFLLAKKKNMYVLLSMIWILSFLIYQSFQFAKTMRYLILKVSFLARKAIWTLLFLLVIFWPLAFMSIYTKEQSRVTASEWIYGNIPSRSTILTEYWDDPLPLMIQDPRSRNYVGKEVHIFDPDSQEKWSEVNSLLDSADYYIMSSNRAWGSIMEVPQRYPTTSQFYKSMLKNEKGFTLIKEFSSYPSLRYLGIPIDFPDQWAEEAFTVYDHPLVMIFKKN
ncbi:MAG: phospholipid carrier-dependent glycosyltransferase [Candidatus Roizmanbacteria bacterium]|nr:phospholipid carrier-dependent glycosyltransferase [Candidatus Roizmanbacteria bacterium]